MVALSFYPHPSIKLGRANHIPRITSLRQKLAALGQAGVDKLYLRHFTQEFSQLSTSEFVDQILIRELNTTLLVIGEDARVGRGGQGTAMILRDELLKHGRRCEVLSLLVSADLKVSSRRIRQAVEAGQVREAGTLLGRPFALDARVVRGDGRGRKIDFPTANLHTFAQILPANGVYACRLRLGDQLFFAVTNVGTRPTFNGVGKRAESHVIDAPSSLASMLKYGTRCQVEIVERLRDELRFEGVEALKRQIAQDISIARQLLAKSTDL